MQQRETQLDKLDSLEDIKLIVDEFPDLLQGADELQDIKTSLEEITRSADITADSAQKQLDAQIARVKARRVCKCTDYDMETSGNTACSGT